MMRLIYIEWIKISRNRVFWITLAAYVLTILAVLIGMRAAIISINTNMAQATNGMTVLPSEIYRFPHVWHNLTFIGKYIKIFVGILMILLVTNEFYYNTLRQNVINGLTRLEFVWSKFVDGVLLSAFATLLVFLFGLISGFLTTSDMEFSQIFQKMVFIPGYFLMLVCYLTLIMMLAFLLKKAVLAMGILLVYSYIIEPILAWRFDESIGPFLPVQVFNGLIMAPKTPLFALFNIKTVSNGIDPMNIFLSLGYATVFFAISFLTLKKRDL
ncbi:MAG: ABC transporter permease [Bacteroidales bacterium]|nr:ABC transporter permease [Bacteroidales bacterium]